MFPSSIICDCHARCRYGYAGVLKVLLDAQAAFWVHHVEGMGIRHFFPLKVGISSIYHAYIIHISSICHPSAFQSTFGSTFQRGKSKHCGSSRASSSSPGGFLGQTPGKWPAFFFQEKIMSGKIREAPGILKFNGTVYVLFFFFVKFGVSKWWLPIFVAIETMHTYLLFTCF